MRLNKIIADSGLCARRKADELIAEGRVMVNSVVVNVPGSQANPETDSIVVDGKPLPVIQKYYLLLHKPVGFLTSRVGQNLYNKSFYSLLPESLQAVDPAGRLDKNSSGVLILSNDGDFIHRVTHPSFHLPKIYRVRLNKPLLLNDQQKLIGGVLLQPENKWAIATEISKEKEDLINMTLLTGYNRQIRRSLSMLGYQVEGIHRLSIGPVHLGNLQPGAYRELTSQEQSALIKPI